MTEMDTLTELTKHGAVTERKDQSVSLEDKAGFMEEVASELGLEEQSGFW